MGRDKEFLESQATMDDDISRCENPVHTCIHCSTRRLYANTARRMLAKGDTGPGSLMTFCTIVEQHSNNPNCIPFQTGRRANRGR